MIMGGDKKKLASIIVARAKPTNYEEMKRNNAESFKKSAELPEEEQSGVSEACLSCAEEMIAAFEQKDAKALAEALGSFLEVHEQHEASESEEEEAAEHGM
jgi:hypothetical protein